MGNGWVKFATTEFHHSTSRVAGKAQWRSAAEGATWTHRGKQRSRLLRSGRLCETRPEWYLFPFGKPQPTNPMKSATSFKTVWAALKIKAGVTGRWHDSRHTFITDLAESGEASDETIKDIAGHVSNRMLKHYSHIRMEAKRRAVNSLTVKVKTAIAGTENQPISGVVPQAVPTMERPN